MFRSILLSLFLLSAALLGSAFASPLVGSGDTLSMLKQIQGQWRARCRPNMSSKAFEEIGLRFSFTHAVLEKVEYKTGHCLKVLRRSEYHYRFALRGFQLSSRGENVYAIDFEPVDRFGPNGGLSLHNIVGFKDGGLYLGELIVDASRGERLRYLDRALPYYR